MASTNTSNLDLKRTIETTFENAKGWLFAKYPSSLDKDKKLQLDIQYPEQFSAHGPQIGTVDFSQKPTRLTIQRGNVSILLYRDVFVNSEDENISYTLQIKTPMSNYRTIETPTGDFWEQGNVALLKSIQSDKELRKYISFVSKTDSSAVSKHSKKWQLNQIMELSRS